MLYQQEFLSICNLEKILLLKDFFLSISKKILPIDFDPKDLKIVNLLKEDPSNCDIVSIYGYNGVNYLLRGGNESTTVRDTIGKISTGQIENLLFHGFEPRKKSDTLSLNEVLEQQLSLSMKNIISNAITQGIATEDVKRIDNIEQQKVRGNQIEGVTQND